MIPTVKCLVVDDLEENLFAMSALLKTADVDVLIARSAKEALELLLVHDFALALLDVQMPDVDGFELAELMRGSERTRHVPIIFVTAGARDQQRYFKGYELGAVDFLYKPVDPNVLQNKAGVFFQLNRQKQQLAFELEKRTEMLRFSEMFTAVLSHDLRNPLHAILTSAYLLKKQPPAHIVGQTADRIVSSSKWMARMITDILDLTRARMGGGIPVTFQHTDLLEVAQNVVAEIRTANPGRVVELKHTGTYTGQWDADRLAQVASNLIGNALKHGCNTGDVQVDLDGSKLDKVTMKVSNRGIIDAELLPHVFDPFRGSKKPYQSGLGLGLYIVQQLVQGHHGSIDVHSQNDTTIFSVTLPREQNIASTAT